MIDPQLHEDAPAVTTRMLRQFAALCLVLLGAIAAWQGLVKDRVTFAAVLGAIAISVGSIGLAKPEAIRPLFSALLAVTLPIGRVVSLVLLAALFYLVFTPLGLFFRLLGRDVLHRRRSDEASYWVPKPPVTDVRNYMRQS